jgi:2-polyprenyl-6-methoxyphenol hydroxylase-like FAD-dependent oxidoreductase
MDSDVVIVGGSLAGCASAIFLARQGASVTVLEKSPKPDHFKRVCSHYFQPPGVEVLDRLGLLDWCLANGGRMSGGAVHTRAGWTRPVAGLREGLNMRRELLDPELRARAIATPGVTYAGGAAVTAVLRDAGGRPAGVVAGGREYPARLVVGADGRAAVVARLAGVPGRVRPHGRFGYMAYYEGLDTPADGHSRIWAGDPDMAYAFPQADDLCVVAAMPHKNRRD